MQAQHALLRVHDARTLTADSRAAFYAKVKDGLLPPLIKISARASAVPVREIEAVNAARIAGRSDDEIRALVRRLQAARAQAPHA